jgi:hypothetical protein
VRSNILQYSTLSEYAIDYIWGRLISFFLSNLPRNPTRSQFWRLLTKDNNEALIAAALLLMILIAQQISLQQRKMKNRLVVLLQSTYVSLNNPIGSHQRGNASLHRSRRTSLVVRPSSDELILVEQKEGWRYAVIGRDPDNICSDYGG